MGFKTSRKSFFHIFIKVPRSVLESYPFCFRAYTCLWLGRLFLHTSESRICQIFRDFYSFGPFAASENGFSGIKVVRKNGIGKLRFYDSAFFVLSYTV